MHCKTLLQLRQNMCIIGICLWYDLRRILLEETSVQWRSMGSQGRLTMEGGTPPAADTTGWTIPRDLPQG